VLTQNVTNPSLGPQGLDLLENGLGAEAALAQLLQTELYPDYRQILLIDRNGSTAHHTGAKALGVHNFATAENCIAAGNLLASPDVPTAMVQAFEHAAKLKDNHFTDCLLAALKAGLDAGGEQGELRSAALLAVDKQPWAIVDLRVDWDQAPVVALEQLWQVYQPQLQDYVTRADNPQVAPSYGVPGDP
jgi:uncharacterized Ntn-hydrolase superfamily protein